MLLPVRGRWAYVGTVTDVEPSAFNGEQAIRSIALPEGITYIGHNAFNNSTLESITLPESLVEIDQYAFSKCNLIEITLPANLETLGSSAFDYEGTSRVSPLTKVVFEGNKLETIQLNTFQYCKNLQEIVLPDGLKTIEYNAFENCSALTRIEIPNSVTTIGNSAFIYCTSLVEAIIGDGVTEIGKQAFGECTALKTVVIGRGIQSIAIWPSIPAVPGIRWGWYRLSYSSTTSIREPSRAGQQFARRLSQTRRLGSRELQDLCTGRNRSYVSGKLVRLQLADCGDVRNTSKKMNIDWNPRLPRGNRGFSVQS